MAPKSNPGRLGAIFSAVLVLICMGAGHVSRAANGLPWYGGQPVNQPVRSHSAKAVPTKGKMPPAVCVPVQFKDPKNLGVGKLLVASPNLVDPNFAKTVVLLIRSDDQGIVGLILNRRTDLALSRVLEGIPGTKDRSDPVYLGGPVQVAAVTALLQSPDKVEGADHIFGGVYLISTKTLLEQTLARRPDPQVPCLSRLCGMGERSITEGSGTGRVVHFPGGHRHGFQFGSKVVVAADDSKNAAGVCGE
jgi:Uncharacterized ACR, COG1678